MVREGDGVLWFRKGLADGLGMGFCRLVGVWEGVLWMVMMGWGIRFCGWVGVLGRGFVDEVLLLGKGFCGWVGDELLGLGFCGWVEVLMLGLIWVWDCFGIRVLKMAV